MNWTRNGVWGGPDCRNPEARSSAVNGDAEVEHMAEDQDFITFSATTDNAVNEKTCSDGRHKAVLATRWTTPQFCGGALVAQLRSHRMHVLGAVHVCRKTQVVQRRTEVFCM